MAESGLTLDLAGIRRFAVEQFYGGTGDYSALSSDEQSRVDRVINSGLRLFYQPPPGNGGMVHSWSFLRKNSTISLQAPYSTGTIAVASGVVTLTGGTFPSWAAYGTLRVSNNDYEVSTRDSPTQVTLVDTSVTVSSGATYSLSQNEYDLPDDFGFMVAHPAYAPNNSVNTALMQVDEDAIRWKRQYGDSTSTSYPLLYAIRSKVNDPTVGTRSEILLWPNVQTAILIYYRYHVRADVLTTTNKYAWGASDHSETILAAVLAAFEEHVDGMRGPKYQRFMELLMSSIERDKRIGNSHVLGYNGNRQRGGISAYSNTVTFTGTGDLP